MQRPKLGGAIIMPVGLLHQLRGEAEARPPTFAIDTEQAERRAMDAVMAVERKLGYPPRDVNNQNLGYDIESSIPGTGLLRFIEVKGRARGARTVTITKNEILTALNKPQEFILALVILDQATPAECARLFGQQFVAHAAIRRDLPESANSRNTVARIVLEPQLGNHESV